MKKLIIFFFLISCTSYNSFNKIYSESIDFNKNYSFDEFKTLIEKYNNSKGFPDINE